MRARIPSTFVSTSKASYWSGRRTRTGPTRRVFLLRLVVFVVLLMGWLLIFCWGRCRFLLKCQLTTGCGAPSIFNSTLAPNFHQRFRRWAKTGTWQMIFNTLDVEADTEWLTIDATIIYTHQHTTDEKGGSRRRREGVAWVGLAQNFMPCAMPWAIHSGLS